MSRYIIGITGASGSIYGIRLIEEILLRKHEICLVMTDNGGKVISYETGISVIEIIEHFPNREFLHIMDVNDLFQPIASGSFGHDGMAIVPCSMSTLAEIACGLSKNLLSRAADVAIKERKKLILVPRETPLSPVHLRNMLTLSESGVTILPAMPAFYGRPSSIEELVDQIVGRIMEGLGIENDLYHKWGKEL